MKLNPATYNLVLDSSVLNSKAKRGLFGRVIAVGFLALLLFEFSSHGVICSSQVHSEEISVYSTEYGHEDPCQTMVLCSPSRQREQQQPRFGHETVQHNGLSGFLGSDVATIESDSDPTYFRSSVGEIFRPPDPPFQPPKNS